MLPDRLNLDRMSVWPSDDPAHEILTSLCGGMRVPVDPEFKPSDGPPPLREKYLKVAPAVNKMVTSLAEQGLVILLPTGVATKIPGIHYSPISWVEKSNKAQGRPVVDSSWAAEGKPLNTPLVSVAVEEMWGKITHPTLADLIEMILSQADLHGWGELMLWKMDLANAFGLLFIHPDDCKLMAFELDGGVTAIYIVGIFGWTGTPFAFDPVSRSLRFVLRRRVIGGLDMYVDDLMGCTKSDKLKSDMEIAERAIHDLLGSKAVADDKSMSGRSIELIGWLIDLDTQLVSVAPKNLYKAIHGFFTADIEAPTVPILKLQQLGAYATRYSAICRPLKPFVNSFYRNMPRGHKSITLKNFRKGKQNFKHTPTKWNEETKLDVCLWRAYLCMSHLRPGGFARPLASFRRSDALVSIEFDASLRGFGFIIGREVRTKGRPAVWTGFMKDYGFDEKDSSYQNSMEFIAIVLAVGQMVVEGYRDIGVVLIGDSKTALHWAESENTKSPTTRAAASIYLLLTTKFGITIVGDIWIRGVDNKDCDLMSRKIKPSTLRGCEKSVEIEQNEWMVNLVDICNPTRLCSDETEFSSFWAKSIALCDEIVM